MELIDKAELLWQIDIDSDGKTGWYGDTWQFIETIKNMPAIDAVSEWIPCSEREPLESGTYLVTNRWKGVYSGDIYRDVEVADYEHGRWEIATGITTAWMPLPEPWKGANDD